MAICRLCNEEFKATQTNQKVCEKTHYRDCLVCDKTFTVTNIYNPAKTCSTTCSAQLSKMNQPKINKICQWKNCGKEFVADRKTTKFCKDDHYGTCAICSETFKISNLNRPATTCSKVCASHLIDYDERLKKSVTTTLNNYGVENVSQSEVIKIKKMETTLANYGVENPSQSETVKKRRAETNLKKFGTEQFLAAPEVRKQIAATNIERYGAENVFANKEIQKKIKQTNLALYGVENVSQNKEIRNKVINSTIEKFGVETVLVLPDNVAKANTAGSKRISNINLYWQNLLKRNFGIEFDLEVRFGENSYADLGYGRLLIDVNPTVSHSNTFSFAHLTKRCIDENCLKSNHQPKPKDYHQQRALEAERNGYILLQFFEWMNVDKFLNIVRTKLRLNQRRIMARDTVLKEIIQAEANRFFEENHLFGGSNKQELCIGLFYNNELVHCHSYGRSRFNKNYEWEAIRSASKANTFIPGGFSKVDKYFFNKIDPVSVISYIDLSFSNGSTELLFEDWHVLRINKPSSTWVRFNLDGSAKFIKSSLARRVSADRLLGFEVGEKYPRFDANGLKISNDFVLLSEGFIEVYDCGTKTIVWERQV